MGGLKTKSFLFREINFVPRAFSVLKIEMGQTQPRNSRDEFNAQCL